MRWQRRSRSLAGRQIGAIVALILLLCQTFGPSAAVAASSPVDPATLHLDQQSIIVSGLSSPVFVTNAGDDRLFVAEQPGRIRLIKNGSLLPTPFLDLTDTVLSPPGSEEGLLSIAFHPRYATNGNFYVFLTLRGGGGDNIVERFRVSADPDRADPRSGTLILRVPHPTLPNHNGGLLAFGPDGDLYVGTGDGGFSTNAQDTTSLSGKILRIDVNSGSPYAIPPGNPFAGDMTSKKKEIWAYGLRNPWRYAFDPPSGQLYVADVGQNTWEEVNVVAAVMPGVNYGWDITEGMHCYPPGTTTCNTSGITLPVIEYGHNPECSVTGGYVYRGTAYPQMVGLYFFADYCSGRIWVLDQPSAGVWRRTEVLHTPYFITSFGMDRSGELYFTDSGGGLHHIIVAPAAPLPVTRPGAAATGSGPAPLPQARP